MAEQDAKAKSASVSNEICNKKDGASKQINKFTPLGLLSSPFGGIASMQIQAPTFLKNFNFFDAKGTEGKSVMKLQAVVRRFLATKQMLSVYKPNEYLRLQCEKLYDECCRSELLPNGMCESKNGYMVIAAPNLPRILRILEDPDSENMDLLQRHGKTR